MEGTIPTTRKLLLDACGVNTSHISFISYKELLKFFDRRLPPNGEDVFGFGYLYPQSSSFGGHMICLKVWKTSNSEIFVRSVDFQIPPERRFPPTKNLWKYEPPTHANGPFELIILESRF